MTKINYNINNLSRSIYFEKNILKFLLKDIEKLNSDRKVLLIFDKNVNSRFVKNILNGLKIKGSKVIIAEAEGNKIKNEKLLFKIIDIFIQNKFTKKVCIDLYWGRCNRRCVWFSCIIIFKRMLYFNIPTTMTSIIDSCLGGKTAINYKNIINSIGNYYH